MPGRHDDGQDGRRGADAEIRQPDGRRADGRRVRPHEHRTHGAGAGRRRRLLPGRESRHLHLPGTQPMLKLKMRWHANVTPTPILLGAKISTKKPTTSYLKIVSYPLDGIGAAVF